MKSTPHARHRCNVNTSSEVLYSRSFAVAQNSASVDPHERQLGSLRAGMLRCDQSHEGLEVRGLAACERRSQRSIHQIFFEISQPRVRHLRIPVVQQMAVEPSSSERIRNNAIAEETVDDAVGHRMVIDVAPRVLIAMFEHLAD